MSAPKVTAKYTCSQEDLYQSCYAGANSLRTYLAKFANLKARYTTAYVDDFVAIAQAAEGLPDFQKRDTKSEVDTVILAEEIDSATAIWRQLKSYISDAYTENLQKAYLEGAGYKHYAKAADGDAAAAHSLLEAAADFIGEHSAELEANQNMPAGFLGSVQKGRDNIQTQFSDLNKLRQDNQVGTQEKTTANNAIYDTLIRFFRDGQEIFREDEAIRKQFVFSEVLKLVGGNKLAGIKGTVKDSLGNPISGVRVLSSNEQYATVTDENGYYTIKAIAAGNYTFSFSKEGYTPVTLQVQVQTGVTSTHEVTLAAITVQTPA